MILAILSSSNLLGFAFMTFILIMMALPFLKGIFDREVFGSNDQGYDLFEHGIIFRPDLFSTKRFSRPLFLPFSEIHKIILYPDFKMVKARTNEYLEFHHKLEERSRSYLQKRIETLWREDPLLNSEIIIQREKELAELDHGPSDEEIMVERMEMYRNCAYFFFMDGKEMLIYHHRFTDIQRFARDINNLNVRIGGLKIDVDGIPVRAIEE